MPPTKQQTDERDLFHEIWRAAGSTPEGITIPCESHSNAIRLRFTLYNSVKGIRGGTMQCDATLKEAVDKCGISFTEDKCGLQIRPKLSTKLNQYLLGVLNDKPVQSTEEHVMQESFARIMAATQAPAPAEPEPAPPSIGHKYGARS